MSFYLANSVQLGGTSRVHHLESGCVHVHAVQRAVSVLALRTLPPEHRVLPRHHLLPVDEPEPAFLAHVVCSDPVVQGSSSGIYRCFDLAGKMFVCVRVTVDNNNFLYVVNSFYL